MELENTRDNLKPACGAVARRIALFVFAFSGVLILFDRYTENYLRPLLWVALAVSAVATVRSASRSPASSETSRRFVRTEGWLLTAFLAWLIATAIISDRPDLSLETFMSEAGIFLPFALLWIFWAPRCPELQCCFKKLAVAILALGVIVGFVAVFVYVTGNAHTREWMETHKHHGTTFVRREGPANHSVWRMNFPFGHHNRMAYFSMVAALVALWMCFVRQGGWPARVAWFVCAAMSLANVGTTLNRGAWGALLVGIAVMAALRLGRKALWLLLALPLVFVALPAAQQERVVRLTLPYTYTNPGSTINLRFRHWRVAIEMTKTHPVFGVGYGYDNFENYYAQKFGQPDVETVHAHNVWLETSAESGIPAAILFFAWSLVRWMMLVRLWKRRTSLGSADVNLLILWIGIECAIQAYCLVNLPLRRSLGLLTWGIWMLMTADLARMLNETKKITDDTEDTDKTKRILTANGR